MRLFAYVTDIDVSLPEKQSCFVDIDCYIPLNDKRAMNYIRAYSPELYDILNESESLPQCRKDVNKWYSEHFDERYLDFSHGYGNGYAFKF